MIEASNGPCVFIGKPCDSTVAEKLRSRRPGLDANLGLVMAFFCAGTQSTRGTPDLLKKVGCDDPSRLESLRYRGNGWPPRWIAKGSDEHGQSREASLIYDESWDFLQRYRQWRFYICPDHAREFADIAVGDHPWYRKVEPGEPGSSLIIARTKRVVEILERAVKEGLVTLTSRDATLLPRSQPNLLRTRGRLWGQLIALRLARVPTPRYRGFPMFRFWVSQRSPRFWVESIGGTWKRVKRKRLRDRVAVGEQVAR
jgi:coenzyme F420 hydrogenase subunit beta